MVNTQTLQPPSTSLVTSATDQALGITAPTSVTLWQDPAEAGQGLIVHYKTKDAPVGSKLHLVLVERGIVTPTIPAGENAGEQLEHDAAARWYRVVSPEKGVVNITLAPDVVLENARLIGFVQRPGTMELYGGSWLETLTL